MKLSILAGLLLLVSCGGERENRPPEIRLGRDECAECGMIISEDRYSCALVLDSGEAALFDDAGCMLDYEKDKKPRVAARYVRDETSRGWLSADVAVFAFTDGKAATPMGSGIAASSSQARAEAITKEFGGQTATLKDLAELRETWKAKRQRE